MTTAITADVMLAALKKWGITPRFYKPDWRTHNRDEQQGWGPINGFVVHNFGSDVSDTSSLAYLYNGDLARGMPGPLSQFAITDDGQVWVIGWGTANHTGFMDKDLHALVLKDAAPLSADFKPDGSGSTPSGGTPQPNPHYIGVEMTYGKAPTVAQRTSVARLGAALMDMLGAGYTGGSVVGHRECTTQRSDPVGVPMWQLRRDINALLKAGAPKPTPVPTQEPDMKFSDKIPGTDVTVGQALLRGLHAYGQTTAGGWLRELSVATQAQTNKQAEALGALAADVDNIPDTVRALLKDAAVTVDVNFAPPAPPTQP